MYLCVLLESILPHSTIPRFDFGTVLMLWCFLFVFHLFYKITYNKIDHDLITFIKLLQLKKCEV